MLSTNSIYIPICVFTQKIDGIQRVRLDYASITINNGNTYYETNVSSGPTSKNGYWTHTFTFLAISPLFRPIPRGMNLIRASKSIAFPYATTSISAVFDPFSATNDSFSCVSFIAYTQPVPNTIKLYIDYGGDVVNGNYAWVTNVSQTPIEKLHNKFPQPLKSIYVFQMIPPLFRCLNARVLPNYKGAPLQEVAPLCLQNQHKTLFQNLNKLNLKDY